MFSATPAVDIYSVPNFNVVGEACEWLDSTARMPQAAPCEKVDSEELWTRSTSINEDFFPF